MSLKGKSIEELSMMSDDTIDYSDIPETDEEFWEGAELVINENKKLTNIRLSPKVIRYFKMNFPKYQTAIDNVLLSYVNAQEKKGN